MKFTYDLFDVDKPMFGGLVFPVNVVNEAIACTKQPGMFDHNGILELCRFEEPGIPEDYYLLNDLVTSKLAGSGRLLEVIGYVREIIIDHGVVRCSGMVQSKTAWHADRPIEDHVAIPYMDLHCEHQKDGIKVVKSFTFTEVVLVYQAVTRLALRKFHQNKSILGVDKRRHWA